MNQAIKLAIEKGGYRNPDHYAQTELAAGSDELERRATLDPLFWQALGKALGWGIHTGQPPFWKAQALRYFGLVLTGGDTEKFGRDILNQ